MLAGGAGENGGGAGGAGCDECGTGGVASLPNTEVKDPPPGADGDGGGVCATGFASNGGGAAVGGDAAGAAGDVAAGGAGGVWAAKSPVKLSAFSAGGDTGWARAVGGGGDGGAACAPNIAVKPPGSLLTGARDDGGAGGCDGNAGADLLGRAGGVGVADAGCVNEAGGGGGGICATDGIEGAAFGITGADITTVAAFCRSSLGAATPAAASHAFSVVKLCRK